MTPLTSKSNFWMRCCLTLCVVAALPVSLLAQRASAALEGTVLDSAGAVVVKATITVTSAETAFMRSTETNQAGSYSFPDLTPGTYAVSVEAPGFKKEVASNLRLFVGPPVTQDFTLVVGAVSDQISVTAATPLLRVTSSEIGTVVEGKALTELPLNGRNFLQLNLLAPGNTRSKNSGTFDDVQIDPTSKGFNTNGSHMDYNQYLLDGVSIKEYQHGTNMYSPSVDAIQEFNQGSSNYGAAFGAEAGAQVSLVTKSGTNQYHGDMFDFLRNNVFDARNFFAVTDGAPPYRRNQFGATIGGPIVIPHFYNGKDKTFFFFSYQGFRDSKLSPTLSLYPTPSELAGDLSDLVAAGGKPLIDPRTGAPIPGGKIPASRIPSTLETFLQNGIGKGPWIPAPNANGPGYNYYLSSAYRFDSDQFIGRVDQALGSKTFLYARYVNNVGDLLNPSSNPNFSYTQGNETESGALHLSTLFTPNLVGELTFGYSHFHQNERYSTANKYDIVNQLLQIKGLSTLPDSWEAPGWSVAGYAALGQGGSQPRQWEPTNIELRPAFSWVKGKHNMKFGAEFTRFLDTFKEIILPVGSFSYSGQFSNYALGDFLLSAPNFAETSPQPFDPEQRYNEVGGYFQDDWKVTPRLTVNVGLRYEWSGVPRSSNNSFSDIYLPPNNGEPTVVVSQGAQGVKIGNVQYPLLTIVPYVTAKSVGLPNSLIFSDTKDWGPRLGFAYLVPGISNTVVRAAYGIFYQRDTENKWVDMALNPPFVSVNTQSYDQTNVNQFDFYNPAPTASISALGYYANDPYMKNGRVQQYNFTIQHTAWNTLFEAGYVGNEAHHLPDLEAPNQAEPGPGSIASRRRWPDFGTLYYQNYNGNANYNSFQTKVQHNYSNGFMLLASYTFSKTIDDTGGTFVGEGGRGFVFQDSYNRRADRGLASQDSRHRLVISYVYELPFGKGRRYLNQGGFTDQVLGGWQANGITSFQAGLPVFITQDCNRANSDIGAARPDLVGDWHLDPSRPHGQVVAQYFNPNAFLNVCPGPNGPFSWGNAGRNIVIGPGSQVWDFGLYKAFHLPRENTQLQFRFEAFNLFNHPVFGQPDSGAGDGGFGTITYTAQDSRELQFALKFVF